MLCVRLSIRPSVRHIGPIRVPRVRESRTVTYAYRKHTADIDNGPICSFLTPARTSPSPKIVTQSYPPVFKIRRLIDRFPLECLESRLRKVQLSIISGPCRCFAMSLTQRPNVTRVSNGWRVCWFINKIEILPN